MSVKLKHEILKLLKEDLEFRYTIAGFLGLDEILKRLDKHGEELVKLREDMNKGFARHDEELVKLREDMIKGFTRYDEELAKLREDMIAGFKRYDEELTKLREDMNKGFARHDEELARLREDFNKMFEAVNLRFDKVELRLNRVERTLEKLTVDIEDEARSIVKHRIKEDLGLEMEIGSLILPDVELNIYGVLDDVCVIGEATVRGSPKTMKELLEKIELLKNKYPNKLRAKLIPIIYVCLPLPELIEEAKKKNVWLLKATKDYYKPSRLK